MTGLGQDNGALSLWTQNPTGDWFASSVPSHHPASPSTATTTFARNVQAISGALWVPKAAGIVPTSCVRCPAASPSVPKNTNGRPHHPGRNSRTSRFSPAPHPQGRPQEATSDGRVVEADATEKDIENAIKFSPGVRHHQDAGRRGWCRDRRIGEVGWKLLGSRPNSLTWMAGRRYRMNATEYLASA